jgi:hypothetical protein
MKNNKEQLDGIKHYHIDVTNKEQFDQLLQDIKGLDEDTTIEDEEGYEPEVDINRDIGMLEKVRDDLKKCSNERIRNITQNEKEYKTVLKHVNVIRNFEALPFYDIQATCRFLQLDNFYPWLKFISANKKEVDDLIRAIDYFAHWMPSYTREQVNELSRQFDEQVAEEEIKKEYNTRFINLNKSK